LEKTPMPRLRSIKYNIEIFPERRNMVMQGDAIMQNPYATPIEEVHLTLNRLYHTTVDIPGAKLVKDDTRLYYQIYKFSPPLAPYESRAVHFTVKNNTRGFENEVSDLTVVQNGTFFSNQIGPIIGYTSQNELSDPADRKKYGLGEQVLMPPLERNCTTD